MVRDLYHVVDRVTVRRDDASQAFALSDRPDAPLSESEVKAILLRSQAVFDGTAAYFLRRGGGHE